MKIFLYTLLFATIAFAQVATLQPTLQLKQIDNCWVPFQKDMPLPGFEKQQRATLDLRGVWRKERFTANHLLTLRRRDAENLAQMTFEAQGRNLSNYTDSLWSESTLSAMENELQGYEAAPEFYENGVWYRRTFDVPDSLQGKFVKLVFYAVNYVADVWLNDHYLGYHEGGYTPFAFDVTAHLKYGQKNLLAVRVDNPPWGSRNDIIPFVQVDWFNYTGVIHDVYLEVAAPVHIARADVVPLDVAGNIQVTNVFYNSSASEQNIRARIELFIADVTLAKIGSEMVSDLLGTAVGITGETETVLSVPPGNARAWRTSLRIDPVKLWWPKTPNLYVIKITMIQGSQIIDSFFSQFGVRTVSISGNKVLLNGKPAFFTGTARHEDHPFYGRSLPISQILSDLQKIKNMNVNFLRTAHYPNHPATYLFADRLGLCIMEEIPVYWFDNKQVWDVQNNQRHIHEQMWREMIFRDYNRPSIVLWGTCNECMDVSNRQIYIQRVHTDLDTRYADGRLVTQSAAANRPGAHDASQVACDVAGWTTYFGVFYGSDYYNDTKLFLNQAQQQYPDKPVLITEYGFWSSENGSSAVRQRDVFTHHINMSDRII